MLLKEHDAREDMKVWLSADEVDELIAHPEDTQRQIAYGLGARCGLRSHEILQVQPHHVRDSDIGTMLSVPEGKGDKYRQTPIPTELATQIRTVGDVRGDSTAPVIEVSTTRALRGWIQRDRDALSADDDRWRFVSMHDLRRTWATQLASADVDPMIVLEWGGWNDLETFLNHYKGEYTPEAQQREREKVSWLD